ncbi:MAG: family 43 glycosylhydrolase, partial [Vallitaleaceae bacterium]|nr:family 43 glycosylhydrolase [Vallitaleaceae bacterium]
MPFVAARVGNLGIVQYIVEYSKASMNMVDQKNRNILHYATESGKLDVVVYLVEKVGMSPVVADRDLVTPFDIAQRNKYLDIIAYYETVCGCSFEEMYRNPIRSGMFPDPSIVRVGEDYYMVNSSFVFFPCIPISHSKDLIHWRIIGHAITNPKWAYLDELEGGRGYWAPDISYHKGKFYITATYRLNDTGTTYRKQMVVSSEFPEGPYCEPVFIDEDGIDPSIFTDDDGKRYMLLNRGARIFEVNQEATMKISEPKLLFYGDQKRAPEGPHLLKKDGYYYLFLAEGGTGPGHRITVSRSKSLMGNYEPCPYNPIMRQKDEMAAIQRCGHGKPVMTQKGEWYMVYLCGRMIGEGYSILGRETALDPIQWTADGWPLVNQLKGPSALQKKPDLLECRWEEKNRDDFEEEILDPNWMFPRPPKEKGYYL